MDNIDGGLTTILLYSFFFDTVLRVWIFSFTPYTPMTRLEPRGIEETPSHNVNFAQQMIRCLVFTQGRRKVMLYRVQLAMEQICSEERSLRLRQIRLDPENLHRTFQEHLLVESFQQSSTSLQKWHLLRLCVPRTAQMTRQNFQIYLNCYLPKTSWSQGDMLVISRLPR